MEQLIYFASAHTSDGYRDLIETNLTELNHIFLIEGATTEQRSVCIESFFEKWRSLGEEIELLLNSVDHNRFTGVINRRLSCAIIDRIEHLSYPIKALNKVEHLINLSANITEKSRTDKDETLKLHLSKEQAIKRAHDAFNLGLKIHDDLEKIYINAMDFNKADKVAEDLIEEIFTNRFSNHPSSVQYHRFLGASTANGVVDYVDQLTEQLSKRYLIKGRAGSGKSTLLRKVVAEAEKRNYQLEIYHCAFDPDSLDMVIIRELGIAIFDSTAPHEYEPSRHSDQLIDLYQTTISPGTDQKYQATIADLTTLYRAQIQKGTEHLNEARNYNLKLEKIEQQYFDDVLFNQQMNVFLSQVEAQLS